MLIFVLVAGIMLVLTLVLLLSALRRGPVQQVTDNELRQSPTPDTHALPLDQRTINIEIAREQLGLLRELNDKGELSPEQFDARKEELELNLASGLAELPATSTAQTQPSNGRWMPWLIAACLPLLATGLYLKIGNFQSLDPAYVASQSPASAANEKLPPIEDLLPQLETHLASNPEDLQGWRLLGVTYLRLQRFADADLALSRAVELDQNDIDLLFQLADAKAMAAGGRLAGEPIKLVEKAMKIDPTDLRGFWMSGLAKQQEGDYAAAVSTWEKILPLVKDQPDVQNEVNQLIADANDALTNDNASTAKSTTPDVEDNTALTEVTVDVSLADELASSVNSEEVLYVYAKAVNGPPMPLAVTKLKVSDLPLSVKLNDSMAMIPAMTLSAFDQVIVGARISRSGNPVAQSGDIFGEVSPVNVKQNSPIKIIISKTVP